jgi:hypothetical protein
MEVTRHLAPPSTHHCTWDQASISNLFARACAGRGPPGLAFDRRWMVVDQETGRAVTQRTHPKMALVGLEG